VAGSRAVLTIVHNEAVFLAIWLRYYGQFFAPEDMYVLDHESTDGSTEVGGFVRLPVTHDRVDHRWMRNTMQAYQKELTDRYDVVLITDVDEIVAPDPRTGTFGDYMDRFEDEFVNCHGCEVLHRPELEPPLNLDAPILKQRGYWFDNYAYSKPLLARVPMKWHVGFHARKDGRSNFDSDLRLIHLHRMDYNLCRARHRVRQRIAWNDTDLNARWAYQNRLSDGAEFDRWFHEDTCTSSPMVVKEIPAHWRTVV